MFAKRTNWNRQKNRLALELEAARGEGKRILDLSVSNPTRCGFALDVEGILNALADRGALDYDPCPSGLQSARQVVAAYYADRGERVSPDDILMTASTSEAYSFIFRAICNPGDEILLPAPSYPLFDFLAAIQDVRVERYSLLYDHGWQTDFHSLERNINARTKALVAVHPNNPTGHFAKVAEIDRLDALAAGHGLAIVADEVFWDFHFSKKPPPSFGRDRQSLRFTLSGLSKICGLPQMKLAWILVHGPRPLKKEAMERLEIIADTYLSVSAPVQNALSRLLAMRGTFQGQVMNRVRRNLAELDLQLKDNPACARLEWEGGWYAVLRVPATRSDEDLAVELLRSKGVYVHPGHFYDFAEEGRLVASLIPPEKVFAEAMRALFGMVGELSQ
jgi:alanine-synthesizing transaminase